MSDLSLEEFMSGAGGATATADEPGTMSLDDFMGGSPSRPMALGTQAGVMGTMGEFPVANVADMLAPQMQANGPLSGGFHAVKPPADLAQPTQHAREVVLQHYHQHPDELTGSGLEEYRHNLPMAMPPEIVDQPALEKRYRAINELVLGVPLADDPAPEITKDHIAHLQADMKAKGFTDPVQYVLAHDAAGGHQYAIPRAAESFFKGAQNALVDTAIGVASFFGADLSQETKGEEARRQWIEGVNATKDKQSWAPATTRFARHAAGVAGNMAPVMVASAVTGGLAGEAELAGEAATMGAAEKTMYAGMGLQSGFTDFAKYRADGHSWTESALHGTATGTVDAMAAYAGGRAAGALGSKTVQQQIAKGFFTQEAWDGTIKSLSAKALKALGGVGSQVGQQAMMTWLQGVKENMFGNQSTGENSLESLAIAGVIGLIGQVPEFAHFVSSPSRSTAREAGLDSVATNNMQRKELAAKIIEAVRTQDAKAPTEPAGATTGEVAPAVDPNAHWMPGQQEPPPATLPSEYPSQEFIDAQTRRVQDVADKVRANIAEPAPADPAEHAALQKALDVGAPEAGIVVAPHEEGGYTLQLKNGSEVRLVPTDKIQSTPEQIAAGLKAYGYEDTPENRAKLENARGKFSLRTKSGDVYDGPALIQIRRDLSAQSLPNTLWHELVHFARQSGLVGDGEWAALAEAHAPGITDPIAQQEAVIKALQGKPKFLDRVKNWVDSLIKAVGLTPNQRRQIERDLRSGKILARDKGTAGEPAAAFAEGEPSLAGKNADTDKAREQMDLAELVKGHAPGSTMPDHVAETEAIKQGIPAKAMLIADDLLLGRRDQLNQVETKGLSIRLNAMRDNYTQLWNDLSSEHLEPADRIIKQNEADRIREDGDLLTRALKKAGSEWGRTGVARQWAARMREDYSPLNVEQRARNAKQGNPLTPEESRQLAKPVRELAKIEKTQQGLLDKGEAVKTEGTAKIKTAADKLRTKVEATKLPTDLTKHARDLAKDFILNGIEGRRELIDAVQKEVRKVWPETQRRQVIDAISGYGEFTHLSKDEVSVRLRDLKGQLQQIGKLKDMAEGQAPQKTGMERRDPSDAERGLIKEVNEAKKAGNFTTTDPAKELKGYLDTRKTYYKNRMADLQHEIAARERTIKDKAAPRTDAELDRIKAEYESVKAEHEAIFGKPGLTEEQRIAAAEKATQKLIDSYEKRLADGDFTPAARRHNNPQPENLAKLREKAAALRDKYREADPNPPHVQRAREKLAVLEAHLDAGTLPTKAAPKDTRSKAGKTLRAQVAAARLAIGQSEPAVRQRRIDSFAKLQAKLEAGQFALPAGKSPPLSPEIERLDFQIAKKRQEINQKINDLKPKTIWQKVASPLSTIRTLKTSYDVSAVLRQGGFIVLGNPLRAVKSLGPMFKAMGSEAYTYRFNKELQERPNAPLYKRSGLYLAEQGGSLSKAEEAYAGGIADRLPGVKASERAYVTFLNKLRADTFDAMAYGLARDGSPTMEEAKSISNFINVATGRGSFGSMDSAMTALAPLFFSPRYVASRFQMLALEPLYHGSAETRKMIAKEYAKTLIGVGAVYALGAAAGGAMEKDPRSADFGKIRFGSTRVDPLMGLAQTTTLLARVGTGKTKTATGELASGGGAEAVGRFLRTKLAPVPGIALDIASGQNAVGDKVTPASIAQNTLVPLSMSDIKTAIEEHGVTGGVALSLLSLFGAGLQNYEPRPPKNAPLHFK